MLKWINLYTCKEALERLDDYIDRELSAEEMHLVQRHLKICHQCTQKFAFETSLITHIRAKVSHINAPGDLMDRIRESLNEQ